jgi:hypothetical protein
LKIKTYFLSYFFFEQGKRSAKRNFGISSSTIWNGGVIPFEISDDFGMGFVPE